MTNEAIASRRQRKPSIFVGSSSEGLDHARAIQSLLEHDADVTVWTQGVFAPGNYPLDDILRQLELADFGIFVFTPDDVTRMRGTEMLVARDNVVLELGIFFGKLGRRRALIVKPRGGDSLHLPTDLAGLTIADYDASRDDGNISAILGTAVTRLLEVVRREGPLPSRAPVLLEPQDPAQAVLKGIATVADQIRRAIGPYGRGTAMTLPSGEQVVVKSGSMIARATAAEGLEKVGVEFLRRTTQQMDDTVGDGAKVAAVLAAEMCARGRAAIAGGEQAKQVLDGMAQAVDSACRTLVARSQPSDLESLQAVASTAAQSSAHGKLVVEALRAATANGLVTIQEGAGQRVELQITEGAELPFGYADRAFGLDQPDGIVQYEDCLLLISEVPITRFEEVLPILEAVAHTGRPLVIVAPELSELVCATLMENNRQGVLRAVGVKAALRASVRVDILEDLAVLTGANLVTPMRGIALAGLVLSDLGGAKRIEVSADRLVISDGTGAPERIAARVGQIDRQLEGSVGDYAREQLYERLARLGGAIAVITVGGTTYNDIFDARYQLESALHAARAAIEEGTLEGGCEPLVRASVELISEVIAADGVRAGRDVVAAALLAPTNALVRTRNGSLTTGSSKLTGERPGVGYAVEADAVCSLREAGILDARKVLVAALRIAFSNAKAFLSTESWDGVREPAQSRDPEGARTRQEA